MADYRTIKDLPGLKSGAVFKFDEKSKFYKCVYSREGGRDWQYDKALVENNKDWFEEIK